MCATRTAASSGARPPFRSANRSVAYVARTARATAGSNTCRMGLRSSCCSSCRSDDRGQDLAPEDSPTLSGRAAPSVGHRLCGVGARRRRASRAPFIVPRSTRRRVCCLARNPCACRVRQPRRHFCDMRRPADGLDRRPHRVPRPQRRLRRAGRADRRQDACPAGWRRARSLRRRCRLDVAACARRGKPKWSFLLGKRATRTTPRRWSENIAAPISTHVLARSHRILGRNARRGPGQDARSRHGHAGQPLAAVSDAGLPHVGRAGFYQAAAPTDSAISCRTCMALCVAGRSLTREHILRAAARQFDEGDVQHWWLPESGKGIRTRISDDKALAGLCRRPIT